MFDLPLNSIPAFLKLAGRADLADSLFMWGIYMDSFDTPWYVENHGEHLYTTQDDMRRAGLDKYTDILEAQKWRMAVLAEMFDRGLSIRCNVADRFVVEREGDYYKVRLESVGRYRTWCWIDQRSTETFPADRPHEAFLDLVRRYNDLLEK